jgi:hypothetical protein
LLEIRGYVDSRCCFTNTTLEADNCDNHIFIVLIAFRKCNIPKC